MEVTGKDFRPYRSGYERRKDQRAARYAQPRTDWAHLEHRYRDFPLLALQIGRAIYPSTRATPNLDIVLRLSGENLRTHFT